MGWIDGFIIPLIKITFLFGIVGTILFFIGKGFWNAWSKQTQFFFKYKIMKKAYPEKTLKWCLDCMENGIGYYDAKKILMVKNYPTPKINEILWIYDQIISELNNQKGGKINGRNFKGCNSKTESTAELPNISS